MKLKKSLVNEKKGSEKWEEEWSVEKEKRGDGRRRRKNGKGNECVSEKGNKENFKNKNGKGKKKE